MADRSFFHRNVWARIAVRARNHKLVIRSTQFKAWLAEDYNDVTRYILSQDQLNAGEIVPSNKVAKEILDEVSTMWDEYGVLYGDKTWSATSHSNVEIHKILTKLKVAVMGRGVEVKPVQLVVKRGRSYDNGIVTRFNPAKGWRNAIYAIAWQWADEKWSGSKRGQAWEFYFAQFYRKVSRTFLARGMYLPATAKPVKAAPSKAEVQESKIRRLEERRSEWTKKLVRAEAALRTIEKQLRGHELAKRRRHERTQDEEAAQGSADNNQRGSAGGSPDRLGLQNREAIDRHQPPAVH